MGINERKEREKRQRVDTILEAAQLVLKEKGMEATTVNDVAQKAELGKGTLYLYFKSKDELLVALCNEALEDLYNSFVQATKKCGNGFEKVNTMGYAYLDFYKKSPLKFELINFLNHSQGHEHAEDSPHMQSCMQSAQKTIGFMVQCLVEGMEDGSISKHINPLQTAILLWSSTTGIIQTLSVHAQNLEKDFGLQSQTFTEYYFNMIRHMIKTFQP